jgi:hypothetical protein
MSGMLLASLVDNPALPHCQNSGLGKTLIFSCSALFQFFFFNDFRREIL